MQAGQAASAQASEAARLPRLVRQNTSAPRISTASTATAGPSARERDGHARFHREKQRRGSQAAQARGTGRHFTPPRRPGSPEAGALRPCTATMATPSIRVTATVAHDLVARQDRRELGDAFHAGTSF